MPVYLCVGQLMDARESEWVQKIVSVLLVKMKETAAANNSAERYYYLYVNKESGNCRRDAKGSKTFSISPSSPSPFGWFSSSYSTTSWCTAYAFSAQLSTPLLTAPPCSFSMQSLSNGDRWPAASCCFFGLDPPPFSTTPGPLQLMAWLQRLLRNSNVGPISFSASRGVIGGWGSSLSWWGG